MGEKSDRITELEAQNANLRSALKTANADYVTAAGVVKEMRDELRASTRALVDRAERLSAAMRAIDHMRDLLNEADAKNKALTARATEAEAALDENLAMLERYHEVARRLPNARGYALIENLRIFVADHLPARDAR